MADTEFHNPERIELLTALKETLEVNVPSITWACLWFSHIDKLRLCVHQARAFPGGTLLALLNREADQNLVLLCGFINSYTFSVFC
jgi:hypothetical protein